MNQSDALGKTQKRQRRKLTRMERHNLRVGLLFISPWIVGFIIFTLYPMVMSLYYSFTDFKGILVSQSSLVCQLCSYVPAMTGSGTL